MAAGAGGNVASGLARFPGDAGASSGRSVARVGLDGVSERGGFMDAGASAEPGNGGEGERSDWLTVATTSRV
jgi:hypothetical protein